MEGRDPLAGGRCRAHACSDVLVEQQARNKLRPGQQSIWLTVEVKRAARSNLQ
jgi:hypothetical protein